MTLKQRRLAAAVLAAAGPLVYVFGMPIWRGLTQPEPAAFDFTLNPFIPWLNGEDAEGDAVVLLAMHEWLNNNTVSVGRG